MLRRRTLSAGLPRLQVQEIVEVGSTHARWKVIPAALPRVAARWRARLRSQPPPNVTGPTWSKETTCAWYTCRLLLVDGDAPRQEVLHHGRRERHRPRDGACGGRI